MRPVQVFVMLAMLALPSVSLAKGEQPQPPPGFVPAEGAPQEQIPAMPLLGIAYGFIWVGVFGYVWSLGRKLQRVEGELAALESRKK
jgi:CcmD family protein